MRLVNEAFSNSITELLENTKEQLHIESSISYNLGTPKRICLDIQITLLRPSD